MVGIRFLLDTNVLAEPMRRIPNPQVVEQLRLHVTAAAVPSLGWHEMVFGCERLREGRRRAALEVYLEHGVASVFPILPYDQRAADWHARERARLMTAGLSPPFVDSQIAAIAAVNDLVLVTANIRDFANFESLKVVDWSGK